MTHQKISVKATETPTIPPCGNGFTTFIRNRDNNPRDAAASATQQEISNPDFLAHELRNPLTNINLSIAILDSLVTDNEQKKYLEIIKRGSLRINELIKALLTYEQTEKHQLKEHSLFRIIDEVIEMNKDRIALKNIYLIKDYPSKDFKVILNGPELIIALSNIIVNAIDAMSRENGELQIVAKSIDNKFAILIKDNGCGIALDDLQHIFKPYFTKKPGGLGLGLSTTYDILRANHVRVNVESELGKGTVFILLFDNPISSPH